MATKNTNGRTKKAKKTVKAGKRGAAPMTASAGASGPKAEAAGPASVRDPRLPAPGTVLSKRDRQGGVRAECTVTEDGVQYRRTFYRSLSAAATAAANDLGIKGSQNGFVFWGLSKPTRTGEDAVQRLEKIWTRYETSARSALAAPPKGKPEGVREILERHRQRAAELA
jgi:hypothetical protein